MYLQGHGFHVLHNYITNMIALFLGEYIQFIFSRVTSNGMEINIDKSQVMRVSRRSIIPILSTINLIPRIDTY